MNQKKLPKNDVRSIVISSDNEYIVSGSLDNTVRVWNFSSGELLRILEGHTKYVNAVTMSSDNQLIVSGGADKTVRLWDFSSGELLRTFKGHDQAVMCVAISSDNQFIVSGSLDKYIHRWNLTSDKPIRPSFGSAGQVLSVALSADNRFLVSGTGSFRNQFGDLCGYDVVEVRELDPFPRHIWSSSKNYVGSVRAVISNDDQLIVSVVNTGFIRVWELSSGQLLQALKDDNVKYVTAIAISPDNKFIVSGGSDYSVRVRDLTSGKLLRVLEGHTDSIRAVAVSNDNQLIVSGSCDETIRIWELTSGNLLRELQVKRLEKSLENEKPKFQETIKKPKQGIHRIQLPVLRENQNILQISLCPICNQSHKYQLKIERTFSMISGDQKLIEATFGAPAEEAIDLAKLRTHRYTRTFNCPRTNQSFSFSFIAESKRTSNILTLEVIKSLD